ncbi:16S rRNA (uracil(1498)-N(3))-methyltransferase [Wenzhouxiangella sp. XN24]|uniref:16S rRNA (uracil(1498)-N(3))-methyltransferase n=1 Tax=Wenzhouxiangella sp. XN24 TaxID=2713569 RepID=UPI0013EDC5CB|nr:16S rRNA (uracil(1498)-N(3))-methyltransferase [Wenzhouxiangella sp. XN24]NGX15977.1 16S rRNA (uracil(1498)-N(3))-methyltransferase [Wenzhouxiangella sp. XN24]
MSRTPRVFVHAPLANGQQLRLEGEAAAHLGRVLRVRVGAPVTLFDGSGVEFESEVLAATRRTVELAVGARREVNRESALALVLMQGICRHERMDWVVRKATELGVTAIRPVITERSVVKLDPGRIPARIEHWRAIAISACEQSGRNVLPDILPPLPVLGALGAHADATGVLLDPEARGGPDSLAAPAGTLCLLVGPEGGLDAQERAAALAAGYTGVRLGPRILRTETAALTGVTLLQARFGDLG